MYIIVVICIVIGLLIYTSKSHKEKLIQSAHFNQYIHSIHPHIFQFKLSGKCKSSKDCKQAYIQCLTAIPHTYRHLLNLYSSHMASCFRRNQLSALSLYRTRFLMSTYSLEMGMPFTLDSYIILNDEYLKRKSSLFIDFTFLEILIHEKIHIIQRQHQSKFDEFYKAYYPFLHDTISIHALPESLKKVHMTNPDSNFKIWIYTNGVQSYIPLLKAVSPGVLEEVAYNVQNLNETVSIESLISPSFHTHSMYHPNEIFACYVAQKLLNNNLNKTITHFLNSL